MTIFVVVGYSCYRNGLFSTVVMLFVIVLSSMIATALLVPLWNTTLLGRLDWYAPPIIFLSVFLLSIGIMQTVVNYLYPPRLALPKAVDVGGGIAIGLVNAYFLTGVLMIGFSMFPGTGQKHDKVVFLGADVFLAKTMAWTSGRAGSAAFDAETFLAEIKKEKYQYSLNRKIRERKHEDMENNCGRRLSKLNALLREYVEKNDRYPVTVEELLTMVPERKRTRKLIVCPATGWRYRIFPGTKSPHRFTAADFERIDGREGFIVIYDAIGGGEPGKRAGHIGNQTGNRPVLYANGRTGWPPEEEFVEQLQAQYNRLKRQREGEE